jgi:hypothetical protein
MRQGCVRIALGVVLLTGVGCDPLLFRLPTEVVMPAPNATTNLEFATRTVAQLKTLAVGQPRQEVLVRMRAEPIEGCVEWSWASLEFYLRHNGWLRCVKTEMIPSPYRTTTFESGGARYEMLFYYTGGTGPDGGIAAPQLTPVLLQNDTLVGWGWEHPLVKQLGPRLSTAAAPALPDERPAKAMSGAVDPAPK